LRSNPTKLIEAAEITHPRKRDRRFESTSLQRRVREPSEAQAKADAAYFAAKCGRAVDEAEARAIEAAFIKAYR
jgi:hypothetical protein